jgi:arginyl-tRNA synthetase
MNRLKPIIINELRPIFENLGIDENQWHPLIQTSRESSQGDLTLPCFPLAKVVGKNPLEIANSIASEFPSVASIQQCIAVNGYVNFRASNVWMFEQLPSCTDSMLEKKHILIEHTSANPNGPFHVGRARNAILGDTLVRLHRLAGNEVTAEYYVDDMGKQVAVLAWALEHLTKEEVDSILADKEEDSGLWEGKTDHQSVRWYQAAQSLRQSSERKDSIEEEIATLVHASEHGNSEVLRQFENAYQPVLDGMLETLQRLGIQFDRFTKESTFVINGDVATLIDTLKKSELHGKAENGALFLDLEPRGLTGKTEFFYCRGDGSSLYATRDIAYHLWKWTQSENLVNVLGEDHKLQAKQVGLTLEELNSNAPEIVFYSFIKLPEGKMSTRKGNVVFMDDLLEEAHGHAAQVVQELRPEYSSKEISTIAEAVGTSAVRFNIIKVSPEKGFTFKWEDALAFEAGSAPFVMYAHTRACSIKEKVESSKNSSTFEIDDFINLPDGCEQLLRALMVFSDQLDTSVSENRPHIFANYLLQLATSYHAFYRDCHVLDGDEINTTYYAISEFAKDALRKGLVGLGITPLESM